MAKVKYVEYGRVYHPRLWRLYGVVTLLIANLLGLSVVLVGMSVLTIIERNGGTNALLLIVLVLSLLVATLVSAFWTFIFWWTGISMDADGLEMFIGSATLVIKWDMMRAIDIQFIHRQPVLGIRLYYVKHRQAHGLIRWFVMRQPDFIPLRGYLPPPIYLNDTAFDAVRRTDFGRELYYYAPHLFDELPEKVKHYE